jgi:hypothetical protein
MLALVWQLISISGCCLGFGLALRFLLPKTFSPLAKTVFTFVIGLFLIVLLPQNLIYLGVPVRWSACLMFGLAVLQFYRYRREFRAWLRILRADPDVKAVGIVALLTALFHSVVPTQQGLDAYYGKAGLDFYAYTLLAQNLMDESYNAEPYHLYLRPAALFSNEYKHQRIGQSIIQAEMSVLSQVNAQSGFAATIVLFLTALATCCYGVLREIGVPRFTAAVGAFVPTIFQAITRLSIDAYLSQTSTLFVFVFLTHLLLRQDLNARTFTLFFSLGLAYLISSYTELMPFGCGVLILGIALVRQDSFQTKRLTLFGTILLVALLNPFYIADLIVFLQQQYLNALKADAINNLIPGVLSLQGWSEALFGVLPSRIASLFEVVALSFVFLAIPGLIFLKKFQRLAFGSVLLPFVAMAVYLATKTPVGVYPLTKLILSYLPLISVLAFAAISAFTLPRAETLAVTLRAVLLLFVVIVAARGSIQEYRKLWNDHELIESPNLRDPSFLDVCRRLEGIKNKKLLLFVTDRNLFFWLSYHARNNDVFTICDPARIFRVAGPWKFPFCAVPKFEDVDLVVTGNEIVDTRDHDKICFAVIDPSKAEERQNGNKFYWLASPNTKVYFFGFRPLLASLQMRLSSGADAKALPVRFSIYQGKDNLLDGELYQQVQASVQLGIPQGISEIEVRAYRPMAAARPDDPPQCMFKLDGVDITGTEPLPAGAIPRPNARGDK